MDPQAKKEALIYLENHGLRSRSVFVTTSGVEKPSSHGLFNQFSLTCFGSLLGTRFLSILWKSDDISIPEGARYFISRSPGPMQATIIIDVLMVAKRTTLHVCSFWSLTFIVAYTIPTGQVYDELNPHIRHAPAHASICTRKRHASFSASSTRTRAPTQKTTPHVSTSDVCDFGCACLYTCARCGIVAPAPPHASKNTRVIESIFSNNIFPTA
jgi:hypothetical protein